MEREVGGGIGMGKTCEPKAFSFQCMTKFTTNKKFKKKSLLTVTAAMKFKKRLLLGRKVMTNLDSILESRDITLLTKICIGKAMAFPVSMYRWEERESQSESCSVVSNYLQPHGLYSPWNSLGQHTGVGSLSFLQGSSLPKNQTGVSCIAGGFFTN